MRKHFIKTKEKERGGKKRKQKKLKDRKNI